MADRLLVVSREDWSLHRQGELDQQRHQEKVREAIRENLAELVSEESIILSDGRKVVKVPIRSLEEYRFRFDPYQGEHAGSGPGGTEVGHILGPARPDRGEAGPGAGPGAGDQPGVDYYEAEVTVDELAELIFADLGLPNLQQKRRAHLENPSVEFTDVRKQGLQANLDKRRTLLEALRRSARQGRRGLDGIRREDLALQDVGGAPPAHRLRGGPGHDGHFGLHGHLREVHRPQLLLLDGPLSADLLPGCPDRLHRPRHPGPGGDGGGVLHQGRSRAAPSAPPRTRRPWRSSTSAFRPRNTTSTPSTSPTVTTSRRTTSAA